MQRFLTLLIMASLNMGCLKNPIIEGTDAQNNDSSSGTDLTATEATSLATETQTSADTGTVPTSSTGEPTSGTDATTDVGTSGPVVTDTSSTTDEPVTGTSGSETGFSSTSDTGDVPCRPSNVTCEDLMSLGWLNDCVRYGDSPLINMDIAQIALTQVIELRYRNCPGQSAWEQLIFVLDNHPMQGSWQKRAREDNADLCATVELFHTLQTLEGVFAYPSPPIQMDKNMEPAAKDQAILDLKLCGTDDQHQVQTVTVARKEAKGACTDNLEAGDNTDSVISVQLATLSPYADFNNQGLAITFPNQPVYDKDLMDGVNVPLTLRIKAGLSGMFCVVPVDDGFLNYVSEASAPDCTIN